MTAAGSDGATATPEVVIRLYVLGASTAAQRMVTLVAELCAEHLPGRHGVEVVDVYQRPDLAAADQIVATPTVVRVSPAPEVRIIGSLVDRDQLVNALGLDVL